MTAFLKWLAGLLIDRIMSRPAPDEGADEARRIKEKRNEVDRPERRSLLDRLRRKRSL